MAIALGKLIRLLECEKPDNWVTFDFVGMTPTTIDSYRGDYSHLALGFKAEHDESMTVAALLTLLKSSIGKVFHGYKGGEYKASEDTPVWVANYGESGSTAIVGLCDCSWKTVIKTEFQDN